MTRHAKSEAWESGDYIFGQISQFDSENRGIFGRSNSPIRIKGDVNEGQRILAEVISTEGDYVLAEPVTYSKDELDQGDHIFGRINKFDHKARGLLGGPSSPIRVEGEVAKGEFVMATVTSTEGEHVLAEPIQSAESESVDIWIQQSDDTSSTVGWYPKYSLKQLPFVYHCHLFDRQPAGSPESVTPDEPPWVWQKIHSVVESVVGFAGLIAVLLIIGNILSGTVISQWGAAIRQSRAVLIIFFIGLAHTYAGWFIFEYLIWLAGAIIGGFLGFSVGGFLSVGIGLTGGQGLLVTLITASIGASLLGGLFLLLHRLGIMLSAFFSVAIPLAYILTGGAIIGADLSLTSLWLLVPLLIAIIFGIGAAILAWVMYKIALVLVTSFLGAAILVYWPLLATSGEVGFSLQFLLVFLSGTVVQSLFAFAGD